MSKNLFSKFFDDPANMSDRLAGIGTALGALDKGQVADLSGFRQGIQSRLEHDKIMGNEDLLTKFTPEQRQMLASLPPQAAQQLIAETVFAKPDPLRDLQIQQAQLGLERSQYEFDRMRNTPNPLEALAQQGLLDRFTPEQQAVLRTLDPAMAQKLIAETAFAQPREVKGVEVNGQLVNPYDGSVIYDGGGAIDPTDDIREYEYAVKQGYQGTFQDFMTQMKSAGAQNINIDTAGESAFAKTTGTELAKNTNELAIAGDDARRNLARIDRLEGLLADSPTGLSGGLQKLAGNFGIPMGDNLDDLQAAQALINSMVPEQRPAGSGPMSDADLELFKQSLPRIINTPEGNAKIIQTMRGIAEYDIQRGEIARQLQLGQISPEQAFQAYNSLENPLGWVQENQGSNSSSQDFSKMSDEELLRLLSN